MFILIIKKNEFSSEKILEYYICNINMSNIFHKIGLLVLHL